MTRHPFDSGELGRSDPEMDRIGEGLERYASQAGEPPMDLASRIRATLDDEPIPAGGWWQSLLAALAAWHGPARLALGAAVVVAALIGALALGDLADRARNNNTGSTPAPSVIITPSPSPSPTPSPTSTPTPTAAPSPPAVPTPSASNDHGGGSETPRPSESDNSGPGGGSDSSGPGGGD